MEPPPRITPTPPLVIAASITITPFGAMTLLPTAHGLMTPSTAIGPMTSETMVILI